MPTIVSEFELFRLYSKEVKNFLKNHLYLSRYPLNENVQVEYATPPRAFVKFLVPVLNGGNLNPTVTFYLESMEYIENENLLGFNKQRRLNGTKYEHVYAPLIYKLNYKAIIMVANPSDADVLQFQLLAAARKNKKHWGIVDGQWVEIVVGNPVDDSPVEPGENDKVYKRSVTVIIPRAYLPMEFIESGIIEQVNVKLETVEELTDSSTITEEIIYDEYLAGNIVSKTDISGVLNKTDVMVGSLTANSNITGVIA